MILRTDYAAHEAFIAPAKPRAELWRLVLSLVVAFLIFLALNIVYAEVIFSVLDSRSQVVLDQITEGKTPLTLLILLANFALLLGSILAVTAFIHRRNPLTLIGPLQVAVPQFSVVLLFVAILGVVIAILPPWDMGGDLLPGLPFGRWLALLPLSVFALLIQVSAEEVIFRGYLQQQLAARFKSPIIWMIIPSVLFGLLHLSDTAGENAVLIAIWASVFGILMADLTARSGSLGPAIAVHFCNNFSALLIVSLPDQLSGLALYLTPFGMDDAEVLRGWLVVDFVMMFVGWLAARLAIRR